jgi:hypothetical protein
MSPTAPKRGPMGQPKVLHGLARMFDPPQNTQSNDANENLSVLRRIFEAPEAKYLLRRLLDLTPVNGGGNVVGGNLGGNNAGDNNAGGNAGRNSQQAFGPEDVCSICAEELRVLQSAQDVTLLRTSCNHVFCEKCILSWLGSATNRACPLCKKDLKEI